MAPRCLLFDAVQLTLVPSLTPVLVVAVEPQAEEAVEQLSVPVIERPWE